MKILFLSLIITISGCSVYPVINIPLDNKIGIIYGYDDTSCRSVKHTCSANKNHGDPSSPKDYTEWKDENGKTMCSCK